MKYYVGIDPGSTAGGIVIMNETGDVVESLRCPDTEKDILLALELYSPRRGDIVEKTTVCIEKLWGHGGMMGTKAGIWKQGMNYGYLIMACIALEMVLEEVPPMKWQKYHGITKEKGIQPKDWKNILKAKAQKMFPKEKVTLWSADALLIAQYCHEVKK